MANSQPHPISVIRKVAINISILLPRADPCRSEGGCVFGCWVWSGEEDSVLPVTSVRDSATLTCP